MTLIEVLVALVIFALGMLGAGGLILASMRSNQFSTSASVAISLARDYGDLMQMVPATVVSTSTGLTSVFTIDTSSAAFTTSTAPTPDCLANAASLNQPTACTPDQLIATSTWEWAQRVRTSLPGGRALICKDSAPRNADGQYQWACDGNGDMMIAKFDWVAKTGAAGTGDDILIARDANNQVRPKMVVTLFGNQTEFVP